CFRSARGARGRRVRQHPELARRILRRRNGRARRAQAGASSADAARGSALRNLPLRCVIDTNVSTTANAENGGAPLSCMVASAEALQAIVATGHVFLDDGFRILNEYLANASPRGEPGPGGERESGAEGAGAGAAPRRG